MKLSIFKIYILIFFCYVKLHLAIINKQLSNIKSIINSQFNRLKHRNDYNTLISIITGNYNNYKQAKIDHDKMKFTAKDGGHEYVDVRIKLHPTISNIVIASYQFKDNQIPFRFRYYEFIEDIKNQYSGIMKIYRPLLETNEKLLSNTYDLVKYLPQLNEMEILDGCEIGWIKSNIFQSILKLKSFYKGNKSSYTSHRISLLIVFNTYLI